MPNNEALVAVEPWFYQSPRLYQAGRKIDIGLVAEALIYYETVYFAFGNEEQFARVVAWFKGQGALPELIALLNDRALVPYYYAFMTAPFTKDGVWGLINVQDEEAAAHPVFGKRIVNSPRLVGLVKKASDLSALEEAALEHHVEVKASDFGSAIKNAELDYADEQRAAILLQIVVDELYSELGLPEPPDITARIVQNPTGTQTLTYNFDFRLFSRKLGPRVKFEPPSPLAGAAFGAKTLWSAAQLGTDLYMAAPLTAYAEYKLDQGNKTARARAIMEELVAEVAFPDIRDLVNRGQIGIAEVVLLRRKGAKFREWLRSESQFDRNAVIAYLGELARDTGWTKDARKLIRAVGIFGGAIVGANLGGVVGSATGAAVAGQAIEYIGDLAGKVDGGWRPKVFGDLAQATVERALRQR